MTFYTGSRVDFAVDFVLAQVITTVGKVALDRFLELIARFDLFLVSMTVRTKRFLVAGSTGCLGVSVESVFSVEVNRLMIECAQRVGVAFSAVGHSFYRFGMHPGDAVGVGTGVQKAYHQRKN